MFFFSGNMINFTPRRWLLLVCVISAMMSVGNTSELCDRFGTFGFENKETCKHAAINLGKAWPNGVKSSKDILRIISQQLSDKLAKMLIDGRQKFKLTNTRWKPLFNAAQFLSNNGIIPKSISINAVNREPGFDLTKEEIAKFKMWDRGVIPYFIDGYSFDKVLRDRIRFILDEVNAATSLQFMEIPEPPDDDNKRYVFFINRRGALKCVDYTSDNFTGEGVQRVILGYDCINLNTGTAAMILTLVGVPPQHNAPNRKEYIDIVENNIIPDKISLFTALNDQDWLFHDIKYDFESASHYDYHKYSATGFSTILPRTLMVEAAKVGEDKTFSNLDLLKINMLYSYISRGPNNNNLAKCSQIFQRGKAFNKYKPNKNSLKPREKPAKYTKTKDSNKKPNYTIEGRTSDYLAVIGNSANEENENNDDDTNNGSKNDYSGIDSGNRVAAARPQMLSGPKGPKSAETQKRLKLKQIIQNESDYHTEERK